MAEKIKSINLLPQEGKGILEQFLSWALTIGRLLIILTETLALSVFIYRFSLDMKITDLHDQIKNQSLIVKQFKDMEETARSLQVRLALAQKYDVEGQLATSTFSDIIEMGRGQVTFKNLVVSTSIIKMEVQAPNSNSLGLFVKNLKNHPKVTAVSIDSVENRTSSAYIKLNITAQLKTAFKKL